MIAVEGDRPIGVVERHQLYEGASYADPKITVAEVCSKSFLTVPEEEFGYETLRIMTQNDAPFLVVVDGEGKVTGSVSHSDLIRAQKQKIADDTIVEEGWLHTFLRKKKVTKIVPEG